MQDVIHTFQVSHWLTLAGFLVTILCVFATGWSQTRQLKHQRIYQDKFSAVSRALGLAQKYLYLCYPERTGAVAETGPYLGNDELTLETRRTLDALLLTCRVQTVDCFCAFMLHGPETTLTQLQELYLAFVNQGRRELGLRAFPKSIEQSKIFILKCSSKKL